MTPSTVFRSVLTGAIALAGVFAAHAQEATTDPVGFSTVSLPADSDSYVFIPFKRTPAYAGVSSGALSSNGTYDLGEPFVDTNSSGFRDAGESFTDTANVLTVAGTPAWTVNQFGYTAGAQPKYYVFVVDGVRTGMYYTAVSNGAGNLVLDLAGDTGLVVDNTTRVQVIPFDTLGSVFLDSQGALQGLVGSASHLTGSRQSEVYVPNQSAAGINNVPSVSYYYYTGATAPGVGFRKSGVTGTVVNDTVLYPDSYFIVRNKVGGATSLTFMGTVQMASLSTPIGTLVASVNQDNPVALPIASSLTLAQTKLFESGAFAPSTSHLTGSRKDELYVFDNSVIGKNKVPARSYYYYSGATAPGPGWRLSGDTGTVRDSEVVVSSTTACLIRKKTTGAASTVFWTVKPPYVP